MAHWTLFDLITPLFGIGAGPFISLNSSMSMTVILAPSRGPSDEQLNSDPLGKPLDRHNYTLLWFMFLYNIRLICNKLKYKNLNSSRSLGWTVKFWPPWEVDGPTNFYRILTDFGNFDPLRVKISTLPPLCFIFYYQIIFICNLKKNEIPKKNCIPLLGVAPRDPTVWPLGGLGVHEKSPWYP